LQLRKKKSDGIPLLFLHAKAKQSTTTSFLPRYFVVAALTAQRQRKGLGVLESRL